MPTPAVAPADLREGAARRRAGLPPIARWTASPMSLPELHAELDAALGVDRLRHPRPRGGAPACRDRRPRALLERAAGRSALAGHRCRAGVRRSVRAGPGSRPLRSGRHRRRRDGGHHRLQVQRRARPRHGRAADRASRSSWRSTAWPGRRSTAPRRIDLALHFLESGEVGVSRPPRAGWRRREQIATAANGIRAGRFEANPWPMRCGNCPFRTICPDAVAEPHGDGVDPSTSSSSAAWPPGLAVVALASQLCPGRHAQQSVPRRGAKPRCWWWRSPRLRWCS